MSRIGDTLRELAEPLQPRVPRAADGSVDFQRWVAQQKQAAEAVKRVLTPVRQPLPTPAPVQAPPETPAQRNARIRAAIAGDERRIQGEARRVPTPVPAPVRAPVGRPAPIAAPEPRPTRTVAPAKPAVTAKPAVVPGEIDPLTPDIRIPDVQTEVLLPPSLQVASMAGQALADALVPVPTVPDRFEWDERPQVKRPSQIPDRPIRERATARPPAPATPPVGAGVVLGPNNLGTVPPGYARRIVREIKRGRLPCPLRMPY